MATEWYYLDRNERHGPVSGKKLRELADFGAVFPWTPVRRIYNGELSPWTRAGAVQALFSCDVSDQLGPPICDDCGTAKPDGSCPKCDVEELAPILVEQTDYVPDAPPPVPRWTSVKHRYIRLRKYIEAMYFIGAIGCIFEVGVGVLFLADVARFNELGNSKFSFLIGGSCIAVGFMHCIAWFAAAEFLQVAIDTEENTRQLMTDHRAKGEM